MPAKIIFVSGMHFLGFSKYSHQRLLSPGDTFVLVGICVRESSSLTRLSSKQTMEVWPSLVLASLSHTMALGTLLNKNLLALLNITIFKSFFLCARRRSSRSEAERPTFSTFVSSTTPDTSLKTKI